MTGALLSFSVSALAIRALGQQLTTFEILSIRSGLGLRLGANVGYLKFTPSATWNPF